jgi:transketolase
LPVQTEKSFLFFFKKEILPSPPVLLPRHLRHDPADPLWPDRDRVFCAAGAIPAPGVDPIRLDAPPGFTAAASVGAALAERILAARFGRSLVDHHTWLLAGATELAAGATHEAAAIAGAAPLGRLTIVADLPESDAGALARFTAVGWVVRRVPRSDNAAFEAAIAAAGRAQKPTLIACLAAPASTAPPSEQTSDTAPHPRAAGARRAWLKRLRRHASNDLFLRVQAGRLPAGGIEAVSAPAATPPISPAESVQAALPRLASGWPELAGVATDGFFAAPQATFAGRTVAWGDRAQATSAGLLGMALHGGVLPMAELSTGACDAALPALRVAGASGLRLLLLVREDVPLPEGLLAGLLSIQSARIFRPADTAEALECLALALRHVAAPSLLLLGDRAIAPTAGVPARSCARGGYVLNEAPRRDVTIIASGAEVRLARTARHDLDASGITAVCVSLPCWQLFAAQDAAYREAVLGTAPRVWLAPMRGDGLFIDSQDSGDVAQAVLRALRRGP